MYLKFISCIKLFRLLDRMNCSFFHVKLLLIVILNFSPASVKFPPLEIIKLKTKSLSANSWKQLRISMTSEKEHFFLNLYLLSKLPSKTSKFSTKRVIPILTIFLFSYNLGQNQGILIKVTEFRTSELSRLLLINSLE